MLPRRKSRDVLLLAFIIVLFLYRAFKNPERGSTSFTDSSGDSNLNNKSPSVKIPQLKSQDTSKPTSPPEAQSSSTQSTNKPNDAVQITNKPNITKPPTDPPAKQAIDIHAESPPGRIENESTKDSLTSDSAKQVHWKKFPENFPVPIEQIITLPGGKPKTMPKVQFNFKPETESAKVKREKRQALVKAEMERAWASYRKFAWMHDELSPVSGGHRDPFCGWAATLVDSLDTLWIMGMKEEFDDAAKAVKDIDFTFCSARDDIQVFETNIRYLGGLLAAYDVSGGKKGGYDILLDKAVELAEMLMGVFDTPNRMPILSYNWHPDYVSQPHRAVKAGVAELGTLSMEFTRLAQFTGKDKYYDAVARITNAFEDLQNRGTILDGIFPEQLDVSGCNKTAQEIKEKEAQAAIVGASATAAQLKEPKGYEPKRKPAETGASSASIRAEDDDILAKRADDEPDNNGRGTTSTKSAKKSWDCVEQGITPFPQDPQKFSMGGSQDSAYEYFQKTHLLLGGLEPKYKTIHIKIVEAVKKWLLFRPMVPDGDILFSASVTSSGNPDDPLETEYEVTHLTCFLGGMFGLGGKIFERPDDIEIAKKLTDGCVWAYDSMPSGVMPEYAHVVPCASMESCPWNETIWWEYLDPYANWREEQLQSWEQRQRGRQQQQQSVERPETDPAEKPIVQDTALKKRNPTAGAEKIYDPKPESHEEYIKSKLEEQQIPPGFVEIIRPEYILRPEAIESVWYMYRITGDPEWQEKGWKMWESILAVTKTDLGHSAIDRVTSKNPFQGDKMESFWIAETLKYFYLLYSTPDVISLDEWVLNTEAHPFRRPT